jgi:simple sugar transport system permease protein
LISGGIAGLTGVSGVAGSLSLIDAISPGYGYTGIIIAMLGGLNPFGVGSLRVYWFAHTGAQSVSRALGVPAISMSQASLLLVTLGAFILQNYRIRWRSDKALSPPVTGSLSERETKSGA